VLCYVVLCSNYRYDLVGGVMSAVLLLLCGWWYLYHGTLYFVSVHQPPHILIQIPPEEDGTSCGSSTSKKGSKKNKTLGSI
jgi:hypothetical protein